MNNAQILSAFNLTGSKETNNFAGKLANVFTFLKKIKTEITSAEIVGTGFNVNQSGQLLPDWQLRKEFIELKTRKYQYNDKDITSLSAKISRLHIECSNIRQELYKKRRNKDNSELQTRMNNLQVEAKDLEDKKQQMIVDYEKNISNQNFELSEMRTATEIFEANLITVKTATGNYSFYVPVDNAFYYAVCDLLAIPYEVKGAEQVETLETITVQSSIFKNMDKATKFVSADDLRPAMLGVCISIENNNAQIVATDAHRLYYSPKFSCDKKDRTDIIIPKKAAKELAKMKFKEETTTIQILSGNKVVIGGNTYTTIDAKYPDCRVVIPEYKTGMKFNREQFNDNVKAALPFANKITQQVTFHLNGSIAMNCCDVDFEFECNREMPYVSKDFADTDIAFNGGFLLDATSIFKDAEITMLTEGQSTRAAIFTNGTDNVLLMPLMIN